MRHPRGFVLVNALILVTALAGVAAYLLTRAETGRQVLAAQARVAQLDAHLDSGEALARAVLERDGQGVDHATDIWARGPHEARVERGDIVLRLTDLQGRFNLNRLADPDDTAAPADFDRLLLALDLPPTLGPEIRATMMRDGPVFLMDQIALPARLVPFVIALPGSTPLNVNTAPLEVLVAELAGADRNRLGALVDRRAQRPFASVTDFYDALDGLLAPEIATAFQDQSRFSVNSQWFAAEIAATLEGRTAHRDLVILRPALSQGAVTAYRQDQW